MDPLLLDRNLKILSNKKEKRGKEVEDDSIELIDKKCIVAVTELDNRWRKLCAKILPYNGGRLDTLEKQLLLMSGEVKDSDWKAAKAASAALETRWIALLLKLYSEPHRAVRGNLEFLARMYTLFDIYGKVLSDKDKNLDNVTSAAQRVSKTFVSERTGMELAIWFCNAVRNPRSHTNEEDSVKLFQQFAAECALPEKETRIISLHILQCKPFAKLQDASTPARMLLDWKLSSWSCKKKEYFEYANRLRLEYRHLPLEKYMHRRAGIIEDILSVKSIYLCDSSFGNLKRRTIAERRARRNLKYELRQLRTGRLPGEVQVLSKAGGPVRSLHKQATFSFQDGLIMTPLFLKVGTNYSLTHCSLEPGKLTERHLLKTTTKLYFVLSGTGQLYRGGCCDTLNQNDTCLVHANVQQYLENISNEPLTYLVIHQPPWEESDQITYEW